MSTYRDKGIVLKTKVLRDADRHYTVFTEQHGKVVLLAKGSRRAYSKMAPHMASFGVIDLMIACGRLIDRLAGANLSRPFKYVLADLEKTALAQSFLLTVDALTKTDLSEERIYRLLTIFLETLSNAKPPINESYQCVIFGAAAAKLMSILGFAPVLDSCVRCHQPMAVAGCSFSIMRGGVQCSRCADKAALRISGDTLALLRAFRSHELDAALDMPTSPTAIKEVRQLTDLLIAHHLDGRPAALRYMQAIS